ncbi:MAG: methionyl-tRNA formyltransferase [Candidatus Rokuibacteriota bacterium]
MRVLFYGTPLFALPTLRALLDRHTVVAAVTQPDRPAGRGRESRASVVKQLAGRHDIPVVQPERLRDGGWAERLAIFSPDVAVVTAFGQILPRAVLNVPPRGSINVHASLLPRYRGAAPVAWAIIRDERDTGVTTFLMDEGMDTGPILLQRALSILPEETTGELGARLADLGAALLVETLDRLDGIVPQPQDEAMATWAPRLRREDGIIDWRRSAQELSALVRGLNPWPGATTHGPTGRLGVWRARARAGSGEPGVLTLTSGILCVGTGEGLLEPIEVQPESRKVMAWDSFLRGARLAAGTSFGALLSTR